MWFFNCRATVLRVMSCVYYRQCQLCSDVCTARSACYCARRIAAPLAGFPDRPLLSVGRPCQPTSGFQPGGLFNRTAVLSTESGFVSRSFVNGRLVCQPTSFSQQRFTYQWTRPQPDSSSQQPVYINQPVLSTRTPVFQQQPVSRQPVCSPDVGFCWPAAVCNINRTAGFVNRTSGFFS